MSRFAQDMPPLPSLLLCCEGCILDFIVTAQSLLDETAAVLQEVVANLAASERERVKGVEVDVGSDLGDDAATMLDEIPFAKAE